MLKRHWKKVVVGAGLLASIGAGVALAPHRVGSAELYPNSSLTPGLVATTDVNVLTNVGACGTYSQCHRNTSDALKAQVRAEYPHCPTQQEIDHLIPLALGGADDIKNLWCQSGVGDWNYHIKDKLETRLVILVKAGSLTPQKAQGCIQSDWIACYQQYFNKTPSYGAVDSVVDDPDDIVNN